MVQRSTSENETFEIWFSFLKKWEGGYSEHPNDKGGPTNKGVTLSTWIGFAEKFKKPKTKYGLKTMTESEYKYIVRHFWEKTDFADYDSRVRFQIAEMFWGTGGTGTVIQKSLNDLGYRIAIDNIVGTVTKNSVQDAVLKNGDNFLEKLCKNRTAYYNTIVKKDPSQSVFLKGWMNRLNESMEICGVNPISCKPINSGQNKQNEIGFFLLFF